MRFRSTQKQNKNIKQFSYIIHIHISQEETVWYWAVFVPLLCFVVIGLKCTKIYVHESPLHNHVRTEKNFVHFLITEKDVVWTLFKLKSKKCTEDEVSSYLIKNPVESLASVQTYLFKLSMIPLDFLKSIKFGKTALFDKLCYQEKC